MAKVVSLAILIDPIGSITTTTSRGMGAAGLEKAGLAMLADRGRATAAGGSAGGGGCDAVPNPAPPAAIRLDRLRRYWDIDVYAESPGIGEAPRARGNRSKADNTAPAGAVGGLTSVCLDECTVS